MSGNIGENICRAPGNSAGNAGAIAYGSASGADVVNYHPIAKVATKESDFSTGVAAFGLAGGAIYTSTKLFNNNVRQSYDKTMLGRFAKFGDKIAGTKLYQATIGKISSAAVQAWTYTKTKIIPKSDILKALTNPMNPAWDIAKDQSRGINAFCTNYCRELIDAHTAQRAGDILGEQIPKKTLTQRVSSLFKHSPTPEVTKIDMSKVSTSSLKSLGIKTAAIKGLKPEDAIEKIKDAVLKKDFAMSPDEFKRLAKSHGSAEALERFQTAFETAHKNGVVITKKGWLAKQTGLSYLNGMTKPQEMVNKIKCLRGQGASSGLGKGLAKTPLYLLEGLGNTAFSGKVGLLLGSLFIAMSISGALKKEKGNRLSTGAEDLIGWPAFIIMMPAATLSAYGLAGLKYVGVSKQNVTKYREEIAKINELNKQGGYQTKAAFQKAVSDAKAILKPEKTGLLRRIWHAPFRLAGRVLSIGLDNIKPWNNPATKNGFVKALKATPNKIKCVGGGLGRFALIIGVTTPFFTMPFTKLSHLIFGKPKEEDENKEAAPEYTEEQIAAALKEQQNQAVPATTVKKDDKSSDNSSKERRYIPSPYPDKKMAARYDNQPVLDDSTRKIMANSQRKIAAARSLLNS